MSPINCELSSVQEFDGKLMVWLFSFSFNVQNIRRKKSCISTDSYLKGVPGDHMWQAVAASFMDQHRSVLHTFLFFSKKHQNSCCIFALLGCVCRPVLRTIWQVYLSGTLGLFTGKFKRNIQYLDKLSYLDSFEEFISCSSSFWCSYTSCFLFSVPSSLVPL